MGACAGNHHGRHLLDWGWGHHDNHRDRDYYHNDHHGWGGWYRGWGGHHGHDHDGEYNYLHLHALLRCVRADWMCLALGVLGGIHY